MQDANDGGRDRFCDMDLLVEVMFFDGNIRFTKGTEGKWLLHPTLLFSSSALRCKPTFLHAIVIGLFILRSYKAGTESVGFSPDSAITKHEASCTRRVQ